MTTVLRDAKEMTAGSLSVPEAAGRHGLRASPAGGWAIGLDLHEVAARLGFVLLLILGAVDAWAGRRSYVAGDTISYVDMATGIAGGDFAAAISGHWSPLYPAFLALFIAPVLDDPHLKFSAIRVANFLVFVVACLSFRGFLRVFMEVLQTAVPKGRFPVLRRWPFQAVAWLAFAWGCLSLTMVSRINPDLCTVAVTFAIARVLLDFGRHGATNRRCLAFGALLGIAYLFKAIFFPLSALLFVAAALALPGWRERSRLLLSLAMFLALALPLVAALSGKYERLTFGESGRLSYWWEIQKQNPGYVHWMGDPPGSGTPAHPTRQVLADPDIREFGEPFRVTYAPWYDPTYWNKGAAVRFDLRTHLAGVAGNMTRLASTLARDGFARMAALAGGLLLVLGLAGRIALSGASLRAFASLWLFGLGTLALYLQVLVETRYVAACLPLLALLGLAALVARDRASANAASLVALVLLAAGFAWKPGERLLGAAAVIAGTSGDVRDETWAVAREFERLGVSPGTPVAAIDEPNGMGWAPARIGDWAHLARVRVVSEVLSAKGGSASYWQLPPERKAAALDALARTGARIVVASGLPPDAAPEGWTRIQGSGYAYRMLDPDRRP